MSEIMDAAVSTLNGLRCPRDGGFVQVGDSGFPRFGVCRGCARRVSVTSAQLKGERRRDALVRAQSKAMTARAAAVPRYPACACGGPLMLPEQAGKEPARGRLFCGSCGVATGMTQKASADQVDRATAAAKAEGFEVRV